ncbi:MAG: hypothetical protein IT176_00495 [Acidobacteria bacterium]|nr:hypothetical protein [Acidobacteriota bacterium]
MARTQVNVTIVALALAAQNTLMLARQSGKAQDPAVGSQAASSQVGEAARGLVTLSMNYLGVRLEGDAAITDLVVRNTSSGPVKGFLAHVLYMDRTGHIPIAAGSASLPDALQPGESRTLNITHRYDPLISNDVRFYFLHEGGEVIPERAKDVCLTRWVVVEGYVRAGVKGVEVGTADIPELRLPDGRRLASWRADNSKRSAKCALDASPR